MTAVYKFHHAYKPNLDYKYNTVELDCPEGIDFDMWVAQNRGKRLDSRWSLEFTAEPFRKKKRFGDLLALDSLIVLTNAAKEALDDLLAPNGDYYNVRFDRIPDVVGFHLTTHLDALDYEKTVFHYPGGDKTAKPFDTLEYYFIEEKVVAPIFTLEKDYGVFVTETFVNRVREKQLLGFGFRKLWDSKLGKLHSEIIPLGGGPLPEEDENW